MKKILIGLAIVIGTAIFILFVLSTMMPQSMADFFMGIGAVEYDIEHNGEHHQVAFRTLGEGVEPVDRTFLLKKMIAISIYMESNPGNSYVHDEYMEGLLLASEDETLSAEEFTMLKEMHDDIVTDDMVAEWIQMAKKLEAEKQN